MYSLYGLWWMHILERSDWILRYSLYRIPHTFGRIKRSNHCCVRLWISRTDFSEREFVSDHVAERRILQILLYLWDIRLMVEASYAIDTLYTRLQLIQPDEIASSRRHVAFALRFIIEGKRGFTAGEARKSVWIGACLVLWDQSQRDVIPIPSRHWHDHGHEVTTKWSVLIYQYTKRFPSTLPQDINVSGDT